MIYASHPSKPSWPNIHRASLGRADGAGSQRTSGRQRGACAGGTMSARPNISPSCAPMSCGTWLENATRGYARTAGKIGRGAIFCGKAIKYPAGHPYWKLPTGRNIRQSEPPASGSIPIWSRFHSGTSITRPRFGRWLTCRRSSASSISSPMPSSPAASHATSARPPRRLETGRNSGRWESQNLTSQSPLLVAERCNL